MPIQPVERKLAAILAADVAGYSRLMGQDEAGTLARLKEHRRELIDPKIAEHKGRIVKTTGDGILIEFPSVVEAVACAVAVQRGMAERNASIPSWRDTEMGASRADLRNALHEAGGRPRGCDGSLPGGRFAANVITPLMPYFALIVVFAQRYDKIAGVGTVVAMMLPYAAVVSVVWILLFLAWELLRLPYGPG